MKTELYNQFSPSMRRMLKPNEKASYRILNICPDPDNYGKVLVPSAVSIRPTDEIFDSKSGTFTHIAAIKKIHTDGEPEFLDIIFTAANLGHLFLNGNNPVHQRIYQFLELCNYNASNENRNPEIDPVFYRVDTKKEAEKDRETRKLIVSAVNKAIELDDVRIKEVALSLGIDAETVEEIRNKVEDYAEDSPKEFLLILERASLSNEAALKEAVKTGIIKNNVNAQVFEWAETEKEIFKYTKGAGKNYFKELADYLEENNPDELNAIKSRLG